MIGICVVPGNRCDVRKAPKQACNTRASFCADIGLPACLPACLPISSRISIHDEQIREKLRESLFDSMDLEGYGKLLLESHGVLKTDTLIDIRTELLAPFAESRLLPAAGTGLLPWELSKADEFNLLTGESMRRRPGHRATDGAWHGSDAH